MALPNTVPRRQRSLGMLLLAVLLLACFSVARVEGQQISLSFNNEMVLRDVLPSDDFNITEEFSESVSASLNSISGTALPLMTSLFAMPPHLVIVSTAWATGTPEAAETAIAQVDSTFDGWGGDNAAALYTALNPISLANTGRQPTLIAVTDRCSFSEAPVTSSAVSACTRSLVITLLTPLDVSTTAIKYVLCRVLPTDCALIQLTGTGQETITTTRPSPNPLDPGVIQTQVNYLVSNFTVSAENRDAVLVTLVSFANFASVLSSLNIAYIRADGVQVYFAGDEPDLTFVGTAGQCVGTYWYLIFLIILVPVLLILGQRFYYLGRTSGHKSIRRAEKDIRAGVHLSHNPWGQFGGGGGPPGYGPPGYGPQVYGIQGFGPQGSSAAGFGPQGYGPQGYGPQGGMNMQQTYNRQQSAGGALSMRGQAGAGSNNQWQGGAGQQQQQQQQPQQWLDNQHNDGSQMVSPQLQQQSWFQGGQQGYRQ